jgi:hypothetical protein
MTFRKSELICPSGRFGTAVRLTYPLRPRKLVAKAQG